MRVRVLGPLELHGRDEWQRLSAAKQRTLLATLVINASRPVSVERLIEELWPDGPVGSSVNQIHGYVWRLRAALDDSDGRILRTQSPGYELDLGTDDLDATRFESLAQDGTQALHAGDPARAQALLAEGLALWRGPAYADVAPTAAIRAEADRLNEQRLSVLESRIDADLALAHHAELVPELQALVEAEPFRERLWSLLMLALYRCGRQADALAAYRDLRARLDEELGVEPSRFVQELHQQVLTGELDLDHPVGEVPPPAPRPPLPRQLPADIADFTGRSDYLRRLDALAPDSPGSPGAVTIVTVSGSGGVGKTTLAVHWAHLIADRFPDGQLYVNLRGHAPTPPREPADVLQQFLRALGLGPDRIPPDVEEAAALYRSQLADKQMLVILDNAATASQVRPLLPGSPGCLVLITSRDQLTGLVALDAARRVDLDRLTPEESSGLLARILGAERIGSEPESVARLADLCGHLPLALRIVAANLAADPHTTIASQVEALEVGDRLQAIRVDGDTENSLAATLDLSYDRLDDATRSLFRLASLVPGSDFTTAAAAAVADLPTGAAEEGLRRLVSCHLVERRGRGRYAFHDLLRLYGARRAQEEDDPAERDAAVRRLLSWHLATIDNAVTLAFPHAYRLPIKTAPENGGPGAGTTDAGTTGAGSTDAGATGAGSTFDGAGSAGAWLEAERANLLPMVACAAERAADPPAWMFTDALRAFFFFHRPAEWVSVAALGLSAAGAADDPTGMAAGEVGLAQAYRCTSNYDTAHEHGARALDLCRQIGWREGESLALNELAGVRFEQGGLQSGVELLEQAIAIDRAVGNRESQAVHQMNVGMAYWHLGMLQLAAERLENTLALARETGAPQRTAVVLSNLAEIYRWQGRLQDALDLLGQALALHDEIRYPSAQLAAYANLANVCGDLGDHDQAMAHATRVAQLAGELGNRRLEGYSLVLFAEAELRRGRNDEAVRHGRQAVRILSDGRHQLELIDGLLALGMGQLLLGSVDDARKTARTALATAEDQGARAYVGVATTLLARVHLHDDDLETACTLARDALAVHRETSHRPGEARTLQLLGQVAERTGDTERAADHARRAAAICAETELVLPA
jgi:DNA-binding SARP family transcriptional activator